MRWWRRKRSFGSAREGAGDGGDTVRTGEASAPSAFGSLTGRLDAPDGAGVEVTVTVTEEGLLVTPADAASEHPAADGRLYRWEEVAHQWWSAPYECEWADEVSVRATFVHLRRFAFTDGTVVDARVSDPPIVLAEAAFGAGHLPDTGPSAAAVLTARIDARVTPSRLARTRAALAEGRAVEFGPLTATREGMSFGDETFAWGDLTSLRVSYMYAASFEDDLGCRLRIEYHDREAGPYGIPYRWIRIPALDVRDLDVLEGLAAEFMAG
ncbi:hypothetical protein [Streptomyces hydrogenans]|uniref:hypothetical protein n=1 Tax=Streptomyces hydrogenans TaxID=1873719 RepID=UPI0033A82DE8